MRGMALRVRVSPDEQHDLLATNFPVSHARDAKQFVAFAEAMAGNRALGIVKLAFEVGPGEVQRMVHNVRQATGREVRSLALETYWSRGAILWGSAGPVRYLLRHAVGSPPAPEPVPADPEYLRHELQRRLAQGDVVFDLLVQRFVDEERTPIEDGAVEWTEAVSPPVAVAQLVIPKQDVGDGRRCRHRGQGRPARLQPLAHHRGVPPARQPQPRPQGGLRRRLGAPAQLPLRRGGTLAQPGAGRLQRAPDRLINRYRDWYRLPLFFQLLQLSAYRDVLRRSNLIDTEVREAPPAAGKVDDPIPEHRRTARTFDGTYNDLSDPQMGAVGARFGRNMPPVYRPDLFDTPNPVVVSRELLARQSFIPARSLNILAAAWIQFQVHDWVNHARFKLGQDGGKYDVKVPMPPGATWQSSVDGPAEQVMRIAGNEWARKPDEARGEPPVYFGNAASHWWDGSEVYGADEQGARRLREDNGRGAKLRGVCEVRERVDACGSGGRGGAA